MPDKDVMVQIKALEDQLGWRALDAFDAELPDDDAKAGGALADSLAQLAGDWRILADQYNQAKGKGFKTVHIDPLRHAARQLDAVVDQLRKPRRAPAGQLSPNPASGAPTGAAAVHRFEVGDDGRACGALKHGPEEVPTPCGQLPGAHVHNLAALATIRTGTGASTESLDALIAESVARHAKLDAEGVPDFRGPGDLADPNVGRVITIPYHTPAPEGEALGVTEQHRGDPVKLGGDLRDVVPDFPGQVTGDEVAAYLSGALDDLPADFGPPLQPSNVTDATEAGDSLTFTMNSGPSRISAGDKITLTAIGEIPSDPTKEGALTVTLPTGVPPVPLLGQPGDAGAGYAADYVPPNGVKATYAELLTPIPVAALPPHLSHSQGNTVSRCPAQYRLTRIGRGDGHDVGDDDLPQVPQWANVGGSALHRIVEDIERAAQVGDPDPLHEAGYTDVETAWQQTFDDEVAKLEASTPIPRQRWRAAAKGAEGETWWRANGPEMIKRYLKVRPDESTAVLFGGDGGQPEPAIEIERTVDVPTPYGPVAYRAIIDRVTVRQPAAGGSDNWVTLVIRDYKSGGGWTQTQQQLGEYAQVLRLLGVPPQVKIVGTYFNARKGEWSPEVDLEQAGYDAEWFAFHVTSKHAERLALTTGPTPVRPSSLCAACPVRWACPAGALR